MHLNRVEQMDTLQEKGSVREKEKEKEKEKERERVRIFECQAIGSSEKRYLHFWCNVQLCGLIDTDAVTNLAYQCGAELYGALYAPKEFPLSSEIISRCDLLTATARLSFIHTSLTHRFGVM